MCVFCRVAIWAPAAPFVTRGAVRRRSGAASWASRVAYAGGEGGANRDGARFRSRPSREERLVAGVGVVVTIAALPPLCAHA